MSVGYIKTKNVWALCFTHQYVGFLLYTKVLELSALHKIRGLSAFK